MRILPMLWIVDLLGCKQPAPTVTDPPVETDPPTVATPVDTGVVVPTGLDACADLALTPSTATVPTGGYQLFTASGGTGAWRIEASAGTVAASGLFTAPDDPGLVTVTLSDDGCDGEASAMVDVVPALDVQPDVVQLPPNTSFSPTLTGGSGQTTCTVSGSSGGTLVGCSYTSGGPGIDALVVTDTLTGEQRQIPVTVDPDAALVSVAADGWMVPLDSRLDLIASGGSERFAIQVGDSTLASVAYDADLDADYLIGLAPGTTSLTLTDRHVPSLTWTGELQVLAPYQPGGIVSSALGFDAASLTADLDGDGLPELIVGSRVSVDAHYGGLVQVFAGTASGHDLGAPLWELAGSGDQEILGRGLAVADFDLDGELDLAIGVPGANRQNTNNGRVQVHRGDGTGSFETDPWQVRYGSGGSRLGSRVAACDVDGDGAADLIASHVAGQEGGIQVFLGTAGVLATTPIERSGVYWDGTDWIPDGSMRLGENALTVGDFDGDGRCDVAAAADTTDLHTGASGPGYVLVYTGQDWPQALSDAPTWAFEPDGGDNVTRFGRNLTSGPLDGTAGDDLVVGVRGYDTVGGAQQGGGVMVFSGGTFPAFATPGDAFFQLESTGNNDFLGEGVAYDPDGRLLVAARGDNTVYALPLPLAPGSVDIDTLPVGSVAFTPTANPEEQIRELGLAPAPSGPGVFAVSTYDLDTLDGEPLAEDARALHTVQADGTTTTAYYGRPAGAEHGTAVLRYDVDGDGSLEVVVSGREATSGAIGSNAGTVQVWDGAWTEVGADSPNWGRNDRRGYHLVKGDLTGDGADDLVVAAQTDGRPNTPSITTACPDAGTRNGVGRIEVFPDGRSMDAPTFVWWPENPRVDGVAAAGDVDGDGFGDLIVGGTDQSVSFVYGEALPAGADDTIELCRQTTLTLDGGNVSFGRQVTTLGDLDGDGCAETAVGAPTDDLQNNNEGSVRVIWGFGPSCDRADPAFTIYAGGIANDQYGFAMDGSADADGDGLNDLLVSSPLRSINNDRVGSVFFVPGSRILASLPDAVSSTDGTVPSAPVEALFLPTTPLLHSFHPSAGFGRSVAWTRDAGGALYAAVGMPFLDQDAHLRTGGVALYAVTGGALELAPRWVIGGETFREDSDFGLVLTGDAGHLLIGAPGSSANGSLHLGGAYDAAL